MLASVKELFTPRKKWNQYRNEWSGLVHMRKYIGVGWNPSTIGGNCKGQMSLEDFI